MEYDIPDSHISGFSRKSDETEDSHENVMGKLTKSHVLLSSVGLSPIKPSSLLNLTTSKPILIEITNQTSFCILIKIAQTQNIREVTGKINSHEKFLRHF